MKIGLMREDDKIICVRDYGDIRDRGEVAHMIAELQVIQKDLLEIWDDFQK